MIDSVFRTGKNYYPPVFLEECKYVVKEKEIPKYIIDYIEISSDSHRKNSDEENSDEENSDEANSDEENSNEVSNIRNISVSNILKLIFEAYKIYFYKFFLCVYI